MVNLSFEITGPWTPICSDEVYIMFVLSLLFPFIEHMDLQHTNGKFGFMVFAASAL